MNKAEEERKKRDIYAHIIFERIYLSLMDGKIPIFYFSISTEAVIKIVYSFQIDILVNILVDLSENLFSN